MSDEISSEQSELAREVIYLRGLFVHRHAGIEYAINELLVRARLLPEYASVGDLAFKFESRLKQLQAMMEMQGPLHPYRATFADAVDSYRAYTYHRLCIVHGLMHLPAASDDTPIIRFRVYSHRSGGLHMGRLDLTLEQMRDLAEALFTISSVIPPLVAQIIKEVPLPQVAEGPPPCGPANEVS